MALAAHHLIRCPPLATVAPALRTERLPRLCSIRGASDKSQDSGKVGTEGGFGGAADCTSDSVRVGEMWGLRYKIKKSTLEIVGDDSILLRRITKNDDKLRYKMDRIPFLEEQVRKIRENGKVMSMDIEKLMLSEENRFDFVNEVAAEATSYIEANRDEYGSKKAILHVLSNRMNEAGFERLEAYMEEDPFRPGPSYLKELDT